MKTKTVDVVHAAFQIKAAGADDGLDEGVFTGYASVFGNVDSYGDIVQPGAFKDSLAAWRETDRQIPLLWGHDTYALDSIIGSIDPNEAVEDDHGLLVTGRFDLDTESGRLAYRHVKGRRLSDMSFAYRVLEEAKKPDGNHLLKLDLREVSIVHTGANPEAGVRAVKSALAEVGMKAGRVLSAANETTLREATDKVMEGVRAIESVLASVAVDVGPTIVADTEGNPGSPQTADSKASGGNEDKVTTTEEPSAEHAPGQGGNSTEDQKSAPSVELEAATLTYYAHLFGG